MRKFKFQHRGSNVTGTVGKTKSTRDNMTYFAINFANGPSHFKHVEPTGGRVDPDKLDHKNHYFAYPSMLPVEFETHGGDDVAVYTSGPWSHLFTGTFEQNAIPHMLAYAACIGDGLKVCDQK